MSLIDAQNDIHNIFVVCCVINLVSPHIMELKSPTGNILIAKINAFMVIYQKCAANK